MIHVSSNYLDFEISYPLSKSMNNPTVAIVTGTSRGIGEAIVRSLATNPPRVPLVVYATSRMGVELDLKPAAGVEVNYLQLDIADIASVRDLYGIISHTHDCIDALINNAGVNLDDKYSPENVRTTLDTNARGTLGVSSYAVLPKTQLKDSVRCVKPSFLC